MRSIKFSNLAGYFFKQAHRSKNHRDRQATQSVLSPKDRAKAMVKEINTASANTAVFFNRQYAKNLTLLARPSDLKLDEMVDRLRLGVGYEPRALRGWKLITPGERIDLDVFSPPELYAKIDEYVKKARVFQIVIENEPIITLQMSPGLPWLHADHERLALKFAKILKEGSPLNPAKQSDSNPAQQSETIELFLIAVKAATQLPFYLTRGSVA